MLGASLTFANLGDKNCSKWTYVPTGSITQSKVRKIQQIFILHLQNWIGSIQPSFLELEADTIDDNSINFEPVALAKAHQHLLKRTIFNFINYVKVKWSI